MTVTAPDLQAHVAAPNGDTYVDRCLADAIALVAVEVARVPSGVTVPETIVDRCVLEVGSELYHRKSAPSGITQFAGPSGEPIRVARDPMVAARPLLAPFVGPVLA